MTSDETSTSNNVPHDLGDLSQLYRHTVPIFDYDRARPDLIGSGVFLGVDQHFLVATAAHVLEPGYSKISFGFLEAGRFEIFGNEYARILKAEAQSGTGDPQRAVYRDGLDFAVIEATGEVLGKLKAHYTPYDLRQSSNCPELPWGIVSGWPARKNTYNPKTRACNFNTCYHIQCPLADPKKVQEAGWDSDLYIGLSADKAKDFVEEASGTRIHLPKLEGVSGAGFWEQLSPDGPGQTVAWCLAGIIVEDDAPRRLLKAIRIEYLWAPLHRGWRLTR
jgi:hypothetical protein